MASPENNLTARDINNAGNVVVGAQHIINHYHASGGKERDAARLKTQITHYLKWLAELTGRIELRGIERAGGSKVVQLPLETAYVPLEATVTIEPDEPGLKAKIGGLFKRLRGEGEAAPELRSEVVALPLNRVLEMGQRLVITGGPGCGKTTVLMHMAWALAVSLLRGTPEAHERLGLSGELPLPIFVPLASFARYLRRLPGNAPARERTLAAFISYHLISKQAGIDLPDDFFAQLVGSGRGVLLLLDGLDEVANDDERAYVREQVESLVAGREAMRTLVTCRTIAYKTQGTALVAFKEIAVKPLDFEEHVTPMVQAAYACIFPEDAAQRAARTDDLLSGIEQLEADRRSTLGEDAEKLVSSPLMVRLLLIVHYNERKLPDQRAELFDKATNALVQVDYARDEEVRQGLAKDWKPHRDMAQHLAFYMHQQGQDQGREIDLPVLRRVLAKEEDFKPHLDDFLLQTHNRGGLLEERDGSYRFIHLAFQEFLTARYLREVMGGDGLSAIVSFLEDGKLTDPWWREPILLLGGYMASNAAKNARDFLRKLAHAGNTPAAQLAAAELAGVATLEWKECGDALRTELAARLAALVGDVTVLSATPPTVRARAGRALAKLGDPRPEVLDVDAMMFCLVPAGRFYMGSPEDDKEAFDDERPAIQDFLLSYDYGMGQHPVSQAQFAAFVADGGYADRRWWAVAQADGAWENGQVKRRVWFYEDKANERLTFREELADQPKSFDEPFDLPNHPVVGVSWYEAVAFCEWLTARWRQAGLLPTDQQIRLPIEPEFEKAARGGDRVPSGLPVTLTAGHWLQAGAQAMLFQTATPAPQKYTFGKASDETKMNIDATKQNTTTALGCFANGQSIYGCQDLCGNVWEWNLSAWGPMTFADGKRNFDLKFNYPYQADDGREALMLGKDMSRGLRGGSWFFNPQDARVAFRFSFTPDDRPYCLGFRLVCAPVLPPVASGSLNSVPLGR